MLCHRCFNIAVMIPTTTLSFLCLLLILSSLCNALIQHQLISPPKQQMISFTASTVAASSNSDDIPAVYPLSRKKVMLIDEAKRLNLGTGSYSPIGWSNRRGSVITPAAVPGVYTIDRPFYWNKIDVGCRCTIIRSSDDNELIVHSPVGLDPPLIDALAKLGTVAHVISPNYEHVKVSRRYICVHLHEYDVLYAHMHKL